VLELCQKATSLCWSYGQSASAGAVVKDFASILNVCSGAVDNQLAVKDLPVFLKSVLELVK
jgi:hypothetical protein